MGFFGGLIGAGIQARQARKTQDRSFKFQERMSSTAHVRQVKDLRAAGLNPLLSVNSGASAPAGGAVSMGGTNIDEGSLVQSALGVKRLQQELKVMRENVNNTKQNTKTAAAQEALHRQTQARTAVESANTAQNALNLKTINRRLNAEAASAEHETHIRRREAFESDILRDMYSEYPMLVVGKDLAQSAEATVRGLNELRNLFSGGRRPGKNRSGKPSDPRDWARPRNESGRPIGPIKRNPY